MVLDLTIVSCRTASFVSQGSLAMAARLTLLPLLSIDAPPVPIILAILSPVSATVSFIDVIILGKKRSCCDESNRVCETVCCMMVMRTISYHHHPRLDITRRRARTDARRAPHHKQSINLSFHSFSHENETAPYHIRIHLSSWPAECTNNVREACFIVTIDCKNSTIFARPSKGEMVHGNVFFSMQKPFALAV